MLEYLEVFSLRSDRFVDGEVGDSSKVRRRFVEKVKNVEGVESLGVLF